jgi:hypothetical protein
MTKTFVANSHRPNFHDVKRYERLYHSPLATKKFDRKNRCLKTVGSPNPPRSSSISPKSIEAGVVVSTKTALHIWILPPRRRQLSLMNQSSLMEKPG